MKQKANFFPILSLLLISLFPTNVYAESSSQTLGDNNQCSTLIIGNNNVVDLKCDNFGRAATIDNNPVLLLETVKDVNKPGTSIGDSNNHLGLVESGAKVRILGETNSDSFFTQFTKIEILEGRLKGEVGWVLSSRIQISNVAE